MMDAGAIRASPMPAAMRALVVVRDAWRRLTWRHFAIAAAIGFVLGAMRALGHLLWEDPSPWMDIVVGLIAPTLGQALLLLLTLSVAANIAVARVPKWLPFALAALIATVGTVLLDVLVDYVSHTLVGDPWDMGVSDLAIYLWSSSPYFITMSVLGAFGGMQAVDAARRASTLRNVQLDRVRVARKAYEARLVALQARVEPRFLFETLSDTEALYERDATLGARVLDDLIVYLRAALPAMEETSSTLAAELTLVRTWLDIMRVRSGDRLWFAIPDADGDIDARMPPMLLLPLVQHAVESGRDAEAAVFLSTALVDERVRVSVTASGTAFSPADPSPALAAVHDRLQALYGPDARLALEILLHDRSQATLEIPYEPTDRRSR